ncbi:MAG: rod shape-determining protein RodA [Candidatus Brocadiia bacterium]
MRLGRPRLQGRDWAAIAVIVVLLAIGVTFVRSASYRSGPMGEGYYTASPAKQVVWAAFGAVVFAGVLFLNYRHLLEHAYVLYGLGLVLLVAVLFVGVTSDVIHARRWLQVGPFRLQPSELMKILVILALARYLMYSEQHRRFGGLAVPFLMVLVPMVLIAKEPDLGTALVLLPVAFALLYVAAARSRHLLLIVLLMATAAPVVWLHMRPYQKERVLAFLAQEDRNVREEYQLRQAKAAIGAGRLWGRGLGQGTQNRLNFLPAANNDFIFAVICEEWGFVGANAVLALYFLLLLLCLRTAEDTHHPGGRLIVVGVVAMVGSQVIVNTAMAAGQLPIVGLTLPLISYGGSSLLSSLIGLALVVNVSTYRQVALAGDDFDPEAEARRATAPMPEESFMRPS